LGAASDLREKRKIDALTNLGRQKFFDEVLEGTTLQWFDLNGILVGKVDFTRMEEER